VGLSERGCGVGLGWVGWGWEGIRGMGKSGQGKDELGVESLALWEARSKADEAGEREYKLEYARRELRAEVERQGWAPDVGALVSRYKGMALKGTEAKLRTVALSTIVQYRVGGAAMLRRYIEAGGGGAATVSPGAFVRWVAGLRPTIGGASWRVYKQHALAAVEGWPDPAVAEGDLAAAVTWLSAMTAEGTRDYRRPKNAVASEAGSAARRRVRQIPLDDLEEILAEVARRGGRGGRAPSDVKRVWAVGDWLIAALATGLRPVEWRQARLVYLEADEYMWPPFTDPSRGGGTSKPRADAFSVVPPSWVPLRGGISLIVHSTKHSNNRGNRPVRTLDVTDFPLEVLQSIARMVWRGADEPDEWKETQRACGRRLYKIQLSLWPRRRSIITFYSARHQAMANWKVSIGTFAAAVLAGHGIPDGPERYYAARANSWGRRKDDKGGGGPAPSSRVAALVKAAPPGRAEVEEKSLVKKAGELGMARLSSAHPNAPKRATEKAAKSTPNQSAPSSSDQDLDF